VPAYASKGGPGDTGLTTRAGHRAVIALFVLAASGRLASAPARAEDWPRYLGPRQDGTSAETGLLLDWPADGPPRLWTKPLGRSYSPPVVTGGRLVAFHRLGDEEVVECLDARTGESLWAFRYPTEYVDRYNYNGGPRSAPAVDGDRAYTFGAEGVLTCLELATGRKVWQRPLNRDLGVPQNFFGVGVAPVVEGGLVLLNAGGPAGAGIVGIDKGSGHVVWKTSDDGASYSTPVVRRIGERRLAVFLTKRGLRIVDPQRGTSLYDMPFRSPLNESVNAASPVVAGDVVFLSAAYGVGAIALRVTPAGIESLWHQRRSFQNHWATSIYCDGYLYGAHGRHENEAEIRCLDMATGEVRWASPRGEIGRPTFLMADGHLIVLGERGDLVLVKVDPAAYREKARVHLLDKPCWAPPALANGLLYVRNETRLVCLDLRAPR